MLRQELARKHPGARIDLKSDIRWVKGTMPAAPTAVTVILETPKGEVNFAARDDRAGTYAEGWSSFAAWMPVRVALKRFSPGEKIQAEKFVVQDVDVATGLAYELRGILMPAEGPLESLEVRQTILEGQMLASTAVQRVPDIRKGDSVRIHLMSGTLKLTTQGVASEPAFLAQAIRVMTSKTKRELVGTLREGGIVEVRL